MSFPALSVESSVERRSTYCSELSSAAMRALTSTFHLVSTEVTCISKISISRARSRWLLALFSAPQ